jgi:MFS family permease
MGMIGAAFGLGFILGPALGAITYHLASKFNLNLIHPFSFPALCAFFLTLLNLVWVYFRFYETHDSSQQKESHLIRTLNPLGRLVRVSHKEVRHLNWIYFLFSLAFVGMEFTLTFLVKERFAYEPMDNAWMFLFIGIIIALVQGGVVRRLSPKIGETKMGLSGLIFLFIGLCGLAFSFNEPIFYIFLFIMSVGSALVNPSLSSLVSLLSPAERQGEILGIFRSMGSLARALGPIAACLIYFRFGSSIPYLLAGCLMLIPALWLFLISKSIAQSYSQKSN